MPSAFSTLWFFNHRVNLDLVTWFGLVMEEWADEVNNYIALDMGEKANKVSGIFFFFFF